MISETQLYDLLMEYYAEMKHWVSKDDASIIFQHMSSCLLHVTKERPLPDYALLKQSQDAGEIIKEIIYDYLHEAMKRKDHRRDVHRLVSEIETKLYYEISIITDNEQETHNKASVIISAESSGTMDNDTMTEAQNIYYEVNKCIKKLVTSDLINYSDRMHIKNDKKMNLQCFEEGLNQLQVPRSVQNSLTYLSAFLLVLNAGPLNWKHQIF